MSEYRKEIDFVKEFKGVLGVKGNQKQQYDLDKSKVNIGIELEVSVNYSRGRYSFIKLLLNNIKNFLGDRAVYVEDNTIEGDYGFEIILRPQTYKENLRDLQFLTKIIKLSGNTLNFNDSTGIHFNIDLNCIYGEDNEDKHSKLVRLLKYLRQEYMVDNNFYKAQSPKNYIENSHLQKNYLGKYLELNYLKEGLVEFRSGVPRTAVPILSILYTVIGTKEDELDEIIQNYLSSMKEFVCQTKTQTFSRLFREYKKKCDNYREL